MRSVRRLVLVLLLAVSCSNDPAERSEPTPPPASPTVLVEDEAAFVSPTGNIACEMGIDYLECATKDRTWQPPATAEKCASGEYPGLEMFDGGVGFTCLQAANFEIDRVLPYGTTLEVGGKRCESAENGVTCRYTNGAGFFLSRAAYRFLP